jgi:PmbA protein
MSAGEHPVILHPRVVEDYVLDTLLANLDGAAVANGESHFRREQFGGDEAVLREDLSLRIDPLQPLKSGSYRSSREGVPAARCRYIENGRLVQPVLDLKYANRLGAKPSAVPYASDTLFLEARSKPSLTEALGGLSDGVLVLSVLGVHTQDSTSGDFSLSAPQALRLGPDGFSGRLKATISGNLFEILRRDDFELIRFEGEHTPGLLMTCRLDPR